MKLYYEKVEYLMDGTLAIRTWHDKDGHKVLYDDVSVNLTCYGMMPEEGHIFMPTYKMSPEYYQQIVDDIVEEVIEPVQIGLGTGVYVKLKDNWEEGVEMIE